MIYFIDSAFSNIELGLNTMADLAAIVRREAEISEIEFVLVFAAKQHEIDEIISRIYPKLKGYFVLWFCFPKKHQSTINLILTQITL